MLFIRIVVSFLLILNFLSLKSQNRWVNNYLSGEDPFAIDIIESYDNGYLLLGKYGPNYSSFNWLIKTDINGEVLWKKIIGTANVTISFAEIGLNNKGHCYLVGSTYYYGEDNADPFVMKLNTCGEKEWCKVFVEDDNNYSRALAVTPDGGVVMILMYMNTEPFTDRICLARFDINGNLLWQNCYNSSDSLLNNQEAYDLTITTDGGFLITGRCYYEDPAPPHLYWPKPYYIKTDSIGNFIWETVVHNEISNVGGVGWSTVLSPSSNYYYSSISHYYHPPYGDAPALLKMDINGNIVDIYDLAPIGNYGKMIEAKFFTDTTLMASAVWGNNGSPKAVIIDTLGNIINQSNLLDNEWMANTEITFDNKLLFFTNIHDDNSNFDTYLFKLNQQLEGDTIYNQWFNYDSLCPTQIVSDTIVQNGCGLIVGMEEIYTSDFNIENELLIYPNPATFSFKLQSEKFEVNGATIEIIDLFGQKIKTIKVPNRVYEVEVNVKGWKKGLYLVRMQNKSGVVENGKVMVQ